LQVGFAWILLTIAVAIGVDLTIDIIGYIIVTKANIADLFVGRAEDATAQRADGVEKGCITIS
jgi:hypothetical protein